MLLKTGLCNLQVLGRAEPLRRWVCLSPVNLSVCWLSLTDILCSGSPGPHLSKDKKTIHFQKKLCIEAVCIVLRFKDLYECGLGSYQQWEINCTKVLNPVFVNEWDSHRYKRLQFSEGRLLASPSPDYMTLQQVFSVTQKQQSICLL